jgi:alkylated DNA repair dioxygenase AlkB
MFGKDVATPRYMQTFGVSYRVSGSEIVAKPIPQELELVAQLLRAFVVSSHTGESYLKSMLVNWFANGDHGIGAHSDDESQLHYNSPVFSLSLGASRRFVMTPRKETAAPNSKKMEFLLSDGDLVVMGGTTQKEQEANSVKNAEHKVTQRKPYLLHLFCVNQPRRHSAKAKCQNHSSSLELVLSMDSSSSSILDSVVASCITVSSPSAARLDSVVVSCINVWSPSAVCLDRKL